MSRLVDALRAERAIARLFTNFAKTGRFFLVGEETENNEELLEEEDKEDPWIERMRKDREERMGKPPKPPKGKKWP